MEAATNNGTGEGGRDGDDSASLRRREPDLRKRFMTVSTLANAFDSTTTTTWVAETIIIRLEMSCCGRASPRYSAWDELFISRVTYLESCAMNAGADNRIHPPPHRHIDLH